jgi:hypothetical protein
LWCGVVYSTPSSTIGGKSRGRYPNKELSIRRGCSSQIRHPLIKVERCIAVNTKSTRLVGIIIEAIIVVVKLNPEIVKRRITNYYTHIRLGDRALRCTSDIISMIRVGGKVRTESGDHVLIVLAAA